MANNLISVKSAKALVTQHCKPLTAKQMPLANALNTVLSADVFSSMDMPGFNQSAMDGYAICFADYEVNKTIKIFGESYAGSNKLLPLQKNTAVRIFTGAPVPAGADTVVMQEHTKKNGDELTIESPNLFCGLNVRKQGSEINNGALALEAGTLLTPGAIGFLAGLGFTTVPVHGFPKITIIATGKELVTPGNPLLPGQVYESNSLTLKTALQQLQITNVKLHWVDDDVDALVIAVQKALSDSDLILLTGGVSVGDYDYVIPALKACDVTTIFHKVKQRPGKPLFFGKKDEQVIFGLPGNPSSVLSCYYQYVLLAVQKIMNRNDVFIKTIELPIEQPYTKAPGLTHFLKGSYNNEKAKHLTAQESFRLSSFALANCLIEIPEDTEVVESGQLVTVHVLS